MADMGLPKMIMMGIMEFLARVTQITALYTPFFSEKILHTKDSIFHKRDNYIHFMSTDCHLNSDVSIYMSENNLLDVQDLILAKRRLGQVITYVNILSYGLVITISSVCL